MATLVLAVAASSLAGSAAVGAGAVAGGFLATAAAAAGGYLGSTLGGFIDNALFGKTQQLPDVVGPRLADTGVQVSTYGKMLPICFGNLRLAGNVIWCAGIREEKIETTTEQSSGGKGGGGGSVSQTTISYNYYATLAISVCEGPVKAIRRVWADSKPISEEIIGASDDKYNVYLGDELQTADPIIESFEGSGNVPAYRGQAYVVIKDFPLADYGNRIPNFTFEVVKPAKKIPSVEDLVKSIMLIPGSGEFTYDTQIVTKKTGQRLPDNTFVNGGITNTVNMHNFDNVADVNMALDQLQDTFPNLERVGLVIAWMSDSKFLASSTIKPRIEYGPNEAELTPYDWSVGAFDRSNTPIVQFFPDGSPTYGGTPSDKSVIHILRELQARGLEVMFYPFLQIDTTNEMSGEDDKPWRGRMTPTSAAELSNWFTKTNGYNSWITHYLNLSVDGFALKDLVDVFVIGSEMRGITQYTSSYGVFPGVTHFKNLAATARSILGPGVQLCYAADWSEYHTTGGWYNMDPLWTDVNIDIIGIDAYFPLTPDLPQVQISQAKIKEYWEKGEGWDYYYDDSTNRVSNLVASPITTTNLSAVVTLDLTGFVNHNLVIGQQITLSDLVGVGGISAGNLNGVRTVLSTPTVTSITFTAGAAATSSTSGGGSSGKINKPKYYSGTTYAWKNFEAWWKASSHINPDGGTTAWTAKHKPMWFTEYGFASVDGCANQPNVFVDPDSIEGFYPRGSRRRIDYNAQRDAVNATEEHLEELNNESGNANLIPVRFVWTWDARPFPQFPDLIDVWSDGDLWKTGHWVNGKFGGSNLGIIVGILLEKAGLTSSQYDSSSLNDIVDGFINTRVMPVREWLQQLQTSFFFDMVESDGILKFVKRGGTSVVTIVEDDLVPISNDGKISKALSINRKQELELPNMVTVTYLDRVINYQNSTQGSLRQVGNAQDKQNLAFPLVLSDQQAKIIADITLYNQWVSRNGFQFKLSPEYLELEPTDIITISINGVDYIIRLTKTNISGFGLIDCEGLAEDISSYDFYVDPGSAGGTQPQQGFNIDATDARYLDLPCLPGDLPSGGQLRVASSGEGLNWTGAVLYRSDDGGETAGNTWSIVGSTTVGSTIGTILETLNPGPVNYFDEINTIDVYLLNGSLSSVTELALLNGANTCYIDGEVIQFQNVTVLDGDPKKLRLSRLLRGRLGTEWACESAHIYGSEFTFLNPNVMKMDIPVNLFNNPRYYKAVSLGQTLASTEEELFTYRAIKLKPYSVVHITSDRHIPASNDWTISWVRRTRVNGDWLDLVGEVPLNEEVEAYEIDIYDGVTVVRTLTSNSPTVVYTEADQIADFGSAQSVLVLKIYQLSAVIGRGYEASSIITEGTSTGGEPIGLLLTLTRA